MAEFDNSTFQFVDGREMVDGARAIELLAQVNVVSPSKIRLSNKSFNLDAATEIASKIKCHPSITEADLSDIIAGRPEDEALAVLKTICDSFAEMDLIELDISDNALGSKGVNACRTVVTKKHLRKLWICNNGMAKESAELIADILLDGGAPPLELFHFYNNMSGNGGAVAIGRIVAHSPQLKDLRFSATRAGVEGCVEFAKGLQCVQPNSLTHLDLSDNCFGKEAGRLLGAALSQQCHLKTLILRDAGLGEEGGPAVFEALLEARPALRRLDLSGNDFSEEHCESIAEILTTNAHMKNCLEEFSMDDNDIGSEGAVILAQAFTVSVFPQLLRLRASACELTARGACQLALAAMRHPNFQFLSLDTNQICEAAVEKLVDAFADDDRGLSFEELEENDPDGEDDFDSEWWDEALAATKKFLNEHQATEDRDGDDVAQLSSQLERTEL